MIRPFVQYIIDEINNQEPIASNPKFNGKSLYTGVKFLVNPVQKEVVFVYNDDFTLSYDDLLQEEGDTIVEAINNYKKRYKKSIEDMTNPMFKQNS